MDTICQCTEVHSTDFTVCGYSEVPKHSFDVCILGHLL
jgi:hypothetical protein